MQLRLNFLFSFLFLKVFGFKGQMFWSNPLDFSGFIYISISIISLGVSNDDVDEDWVLSFKLQTSQWWEAEFIEPVY